MKLDASNAALIGIDWGTSSLRGYLIDSHGTVLDKLHAPNGIMQIANADFEAALVNLIEPWHNYGELPMIASGMITSRNGWLETPYLTAPANAKQLANSLKTKRTSNGLDVHFVTGVTIKHDGAPDVMRGEETQIVGVVESGMTEGVVVMPGTHSKWVTLQDGGIENFATFMSGEIFAALRDHTILGALAKDNDFQVNGFKKGVAAGFKAGTQLLHTLFHVRTLPLFNLIGEDEVSDYLSGMLIGAEIRGATDNGVAVNQVTLVGQDSLVERYSKAFEALHMKVTVADDHIVAKGHFAIAKSAGLI